MLRSIQIQNFKSIADMTLELGRVTVLIGANGSGKSNILEAIACGAAAAASACKLDNEFLAPRGIRVTEPQFMRSAFAPAAKTRERSEILLAVQFTSSYHATWVLSADESVSFNRWQSSLVTLPRWLL